MGSKRRPAGRLFCETLGESEIRPYGATGHACLTRREPGARSVGAELARPSYSNHRMIRGEGRGYQSTTMSSYSLEPYPMRAASSMILVPCLESTRSRK